MRFITVGSVWSLVVAVGLFPACSNDSGSGGDGNGGSSGSGGNGGTGGTVAGDAGNTDASGGSAGKGGSAASGGEAGGVEAGAGNITTGGGSGTGGQSSGGTGGDVTGGTGGGGSGGDGTGGTGGDLNGGSGGTGGKGTTPSPNVGCMGSVTSDQSHELTSCGLSVSKIAGSGQTQFSLGIQGKDAAQDGLTLTLQFTDVPTATTYTFASSDYMAFESTWNEGSTIYTATAYDGITGIGDLTVTFDTIDGPFMLGSTTFYTVTGSIAGTLENPPSGSATLDLKF